MNENALERYIARIDGLGSEFSLHFSRFDEIKEDPQKLQLGGEADTALMNAMLAATLFANTINQLKRERTPIFGRSALKARRELVIDLAIEDLRRFNSAIASAPKTLRDVAETKMAMEMMKAGLR